LGIVREPQPGMLFGQLRTACPPLFFCRRVAQADRLRLFSSLRLPDRGFPLRPRITPGPGGRIRYDCCFSSKPIENGLAARQPQDLHLFFLCEDTTSWIARKVIEHTSTVRSDGLFPLALDLPPPSAKRPSAGGSAALRERIHTRFGICCQCPKLGVGRHAVARLLRSWAAADVSHTPYSGKASELFERVQRPAPARTSFCCVRRLNEAVWWAASPEMLVRIEGQARLKTVYLRHCRSHGRALARPANIRELLWF